MGKSFDLVVLGNSSSRAALEAVPLVTGETAYVATTAPVGFYTKGSGFIAAAMLVSETAAALDVRFHRTKDPSWNNPRQLGRLQTVQPVPKNFQVLGDPFIDGEVITGEVLNAGAVLDSLGLFLDKGAGICSPTPPEGVPQGYKLVRGLATMTMVADEWTVGTVVFHNYVIDAKKQYHIASMRSDAALGHFTRLKFLGGENIDDHPGVPCNDTAAGLDDFTMYGDFGTFNGLQGLQIEQHGEGADATVCLTFLIKEI